MINILKEKKFIYLGLSMIISCQSSPQKDNSKSTLPEKPNIIYILADDLGYGDLSCYGQKLFSTPNIDELARNGMKFTNHYSGSTVCAPSRSSLFTGLHTGHTPIRGNKEIMPEGQHPIPDTLLLLTDVFKAAGYITGAFGKWGLGYPGSEGDPVNIGIDRFFGYNCQRLAHHYYPYYLWDNSEKVMLSGNEGTQMNEYAPHIIHEKTLEFIEQNKDNPFFLFVPSVIPHAELIAPEEEMIKFRGKFEPEKEYKGVDSGEKYRIGPYGSQPESHAAFVAMISILDRQVGEIVAKLKELNIAGKTLIIFTSDNGPHREGGADPDYFNSNGPFRGYKRDLYEGGIRVPMIAAWPGVIEKGSTSNHVSAFWDILPTFADILNVTVTARLDGISFLPALLGQEQKEQHNYLYWEFHELGGRVAVRKDNWKAVRYNVFKNPDGPLELYDLNTDIGETFDVALKYPEIVKEMENILRTARTESEIFRFASGTYLGPPR